MRCSVVTVLSLLFAVAAFSESWPTYMADAARGGVTKEKLSLPLHLNWVHVAPHAPRPAWPAPAKRDIWHELRELNPIVTYDRAYHVACAGGLLYFGSSADDQVYCLDAKTGEKVWSFFAEAPVRLAPTVAEGRVYFGSDDGCAYCVDARSGALIWKFRPAEQDRRIPGNGRVISIAPVRTGIVVDQGVAYFFAGLFPPDDVYRCALNAATGEKIWCEKTDLASPQGYLLASPTRLFVPGGRTAPYLFDRQTLQPLGPLAGPGGAYAVLLDDGVISGPGRRELNTLGYAEPGTKETIASFPGIRMVLSGDLVYLQSKDQITALNRTKYVELSRERNKYILPLPDLKRKAKAAFAAKATEELARLRAKIAEYETEATRLTKEMDACYFWKVPASDPYAMILADDTLLVGGANRVAAIGTKDGAEVWSAEVEGDIYGLAIADGNLYASSNTGAIYCFAAAPGAEKRITLTKNETPYSGALAELCDAAAQSIIKKTGVSRGYCLVLGAGEGELAYALAKQSDLNIIAIEGDPRKVETARKKLDSAGMYGVRVAVHQIEGTKLPYTGLMANLVVSQDALTGKAPTISVKEVARVLRPEGGVACIGQTPAASKKAALSTASLQKWADDQALDARLAGEDGLWVVFRKKTIPGAGEWTQLYADAGHTACSKDEVRGPTTIQWFGNPGPREMVDRHHRPMASLYKHGRVFVPADNKVISLDAYNGTQLWELEVSGSRRVAAMKNSGHMLITDDCLYVAAADECWGVDPVTGAKAFVLNAPQADAKKDWGYLNQVGDTLVGTAQKPGASFNELSVDMVHTMEGDFRPIVVSDYLFAIDRHNGEQLWTYKSGAIMNSAISVLDNRICFVESRNEKAMGNKDGRMRIDHFCAGDNFLVAIDVVTGNKLWERPISLPYQHIMFLSGADGVLVTTGSFNDNGGVFYGLYGFDAATGDGLWQTRYAALDNQSRNPAELDGTHGEQWQHPVIIDGTIYSRPYAFDLHSGEKKDYMAYRGGHGCGGLTGSAHYLYGRGSNPRMYPIETNVTEGIALTQVSRPGCWLNIIPAGGIIIIPESSSGCTCDYPVQTSIALAPIDTVIPKTAP